MRCLLLVLLLVSVVAPVRAADEVPPEAERLLWCGSAFYWLAADAADAGNATESDDYQQWSDQLLDRAATLLAASGLDADGTGALIESYAERVLEEIDSPQAPHDVTTDCPILVTP